jgi:serine/threonine-protein kinase
MGNPADANATVVEKRKPGGTASDTAHDSHPHSSDTRASTRRLTYHTSFASLRSDEIVRTRRFLLVAMALVTIIAPLTFLLGGDPTVRLVFVGCCGLVLTVFGAFYLYMQDEARFSHGKALIPGAAGIIAAGAACHYFGLFSPAPMIFMLGIYFYSLGSSRWAALAAYLACAVVVGGSSILISFGVIEDRGLVRIGEATGTQQLIMIGIVQLVLGMTYLFARMSRRATMQAMEGLEQALRQVNQREALLNEANQDLERALAVQHGGQSGHKVGPWRLSHVIGRGAMGEVYAASHDTLGVEAAVKLLVPEAQRDRGQLRRFLREAEVMSKLESPHVVAVHDVGDGTNGPPYIAMELLRGHDLAWHLRRRRRLPATRVIDMVKQVAGVLEEARRRDIVHRDLKPQNLFLYEEGEERRWKVLDFGVSKIGAEAGTLTRGHVIGTPGYMSPEQAKGGDVDHRADVFSLSAIAYRALTGRPAFTGEDYPRIMFDVVYKQPTRPGELVSLPFDVDLVLAIGLAKRPADRFSRAIDFAASLESAIDERLDPTSRHEARKILEAHPWGQAIKS